MCLTETVKDVKAKKYVSNEKPEKTQMKKQMSNGGRNEWERRLSDGSCVMSRRRANGTLNKSPQISQRHGQVHVQRTCIKLTLEATASSHDAVTDVCDEQTVLKHYHSTTATA